MAGALDENLRGMTHWLRQIVTEKNCIIFLSVLFLILAAFVIIEPYDPMYGDKADATTNIIWTQNYSKGIYHIPFDDWDFGITQSVVIEYDGQYTVVNEKGPGHSMMIVPFYLLGAEILFGLLMTLLATVATYMLGKRLFNWRVGFIASAMILTNATVIVMWHRFYWTDAATMHLFILSLWLLVEANYRYNGKILNPKEARPAEFKDKLLAVGLGALSGLAFGASVSTRYPTAILIIALLAYLFIFYLLRAWPYLKKKKITSAAKSSAGLWLLLLVFFLGLICILYPLTQYNAEYFGGAFNSGYDATPLSSFNPMDGIDARNTTESWSGDLAEGVVNAAGNFVKLLPTLIKRLPLILFLPLGIWFTRRHPFAFVLLLIIAINFFTYMSLAWVDMYARLSFFQIMWEPRYFLPALPAICLLGAVGIDRLVKWRQYRPSQSTEDTASEKKETRLIAGAFIIVGILLLCGLAPAASYFMTDGAEMGRPPGPGPVGGDVVVVTTDQLLKDSFTFDGRFVRIEDASIVNIRRGDPFIRSNGVDDDRAIPISFRDWPPMEIPPFQNGQTVEVQGLFMTIITPEGPRHIINVKYETQDYFRIMP